MSHQGYNRGLSHETLYFLRTFDVTRGNELGINGFRARNAIGRKKNAIRRETLQGERKRTTVV